MAKARKTPAMPNCRGVGRGVERHQTAPERSATHEIVSNPTLALDHQPGGERGQRQRPEGHGSRCGQTPGRGRKECHDRQAEERGRAGVRWSPSGQELASAPRCRRRSDSCIRQMPRRRARIPVLIDTEVGDRPGVVGNRALVDIHAGQSPERSMRLRSTTSSATTANARQTDAPTAPPASRCLLA